jgi:pyruvate/2-oxoglutarate dehydrogenase complex dihydrolipoamide dehydrogenase (E3) component
MKSQSQVSARKTHDVIIIGGGSAGYAAARTARDAGADVAIVDQGPLGGLCILRGCMPTKAILRSAEVAALSGGRRSSDSPRFRPVRICRRSWIEKIG